MSPQPSFPDRLRAYRRSQGWTQQELARKWDYSFEAISAWERGKRNPSSQEIPRIAGLLGMEPEELVQCIDAPRDRPDIRRNQDIVSDELKRTWINAFEIWGDLQHIYRNRTEFSLSFSYPRMFENAHHILAVGISLNAIALSYSREKIIKAITENKSTYTLCFLDPDGACCAQREREEGIPQGRLAELTRLNLSNMEAIYNQISKIAPDSAEQLKIMTYDLLPRYNIYVVDDVLITVQSYAYGRGEDTPTFVLRRQSEDGLFEFYASVTKHILEYAKPLNMEK